MPNELKFRHPELLQQLPMRDYIRKHCPRPSAGLDVLDLDLVPLLFGALVGRQRSEDGKFMLVEVKHMRFPLTYAQKRLLEMMHKLLRLGDPTHQHYIGCYLLGWDDTNNKPLALNSNDINEAEFVDWITGRLYWRSLFE